MAAGPPCDLVVHNIGTIATPAQAHAPLRGRLLGEVVEVAGGAVAVRDGRFVAVGPERQVRAAVDTDVDTVFLDAGGALCIPGLVDCHAHPVFAGDRSGEFELRCRGADYEQIHTSGGGIASTVGATREALAEVTLDAEVRRHYDWMLAAGTTVTEAKSGYGLSVEAELACLRSALDVAATHPIGAITTVLAAHSVPPGFDGDADAYVDEVAIPTVRRAASEQVATAADVFVERGAFDAVQARRYLEAARDAGLALRLHGDQFSDQGAIPLAVELGARSVDHLEELGGGAGRGIVGDAARDRLELLATHPVAGVLLPLSSLFLARPYAPGRSLVDAGAIVAVASDFNPGSSYGESLTLAMSLACTGCGLTPAEALTAATANAAWVLGLHERSGRVAVGFDGDLVLVDQPDVRHLAYHVGTPAITTVVRRGQVFGVAPVAR